MWVELDRRHRRWNDGQSDLGHKIWRVELTQNLLLGLSASAKRVDFDGQLYVRSDVVVTVWDPHNRAFGFGPISPSTKGERLNVYYQRDAKRWEVLGEHGLRRRAKTTATHDKGVTQNVTIYTGDPGSEVTTGVNVAAHNYFGNLDTNKWCAVVMDYDGWDDPVWLLVAGEC